MNRRDLRLASGAVLFGYIAAHLAGHALGLVSLAAAEQALRVAVAVWHSLPGTLLLAGAAGLHVALALHAVWERRTLRMPASHALRIVLGLGMPMLVIGHVVATRLAAEWHALPPTYTRIVWNLWTSDAQGRQLALLAPGWAHGCMGLHFAFGHRPGWQRWRYPLFALALLVPVLAGLGFIAMGRELAWRAADPALAPALPAVDAAAGRSIAALRDGGVALWIGLVGAVFALRALRGHVERLRRSVVRIDYPRASVEVPRGWSVLEASRSHGLAHLSLCGGRARCSTCRVRIVDGAAACPPPGEAEARTLERIGTAPDVRLACQLRPTARVAVLPLVEPPASDATEAPPVVDRELAALALCLALPECVMRAPNDGVFALTRLQSVFRESVRAEGGEVVGHDADGAIALFGLVGDVPAACRAARRAAEAAERALRDADAVLREQLGFACGFTLGLHVGPAAIAPAGAGCGRMAVGEAVRGARAEARAAESLDERIGASPAFVRKAGPA